MDNTDTWVKILIAVIVIMGILWWRSDNGRIKWINELQEQIAQYETVIEEQKSEIEGLESELYK